MTDTLSNLLQRVAACINNTAIGFALLKGYLEGCDANTDTDLKSDFNAPQNAHIIEDEDMPKLKHGSGSITRRRRKHKDGTERRYYQGRIYIDGKQVSVYARTQAECISKLRLLREERDRERSKRGGKSAPTSSSGSSSGRTFGEWLAVWVKEFKAGKLRESYFEEFKKRVAAISEALGDRPLKKLEPLEILHYLNTLPRCNSTVKTYDIINGSLQKAEDFGIIKRNPCRAIERPTYDKQKRRAFELAEQCAVLSALSENYSEVFYFLCCTGLRIGEFLALRAQNVDFARHCIKVEASLNARTGIESKTKTAAGVRKVYFNDRLFEVFDIALLGTFTYNGIKKAFKKVFTALSLKDISATHSCRHTYASMLYAVNIPDKIIQQQCGHASAETTLNVYTDILLQGDSPILEYFILLKDTLKSTLLTY